MAVHELFEARRKVGARLSLDIRRKRRSQRGVSCQESREDILHSHAEPRKAPLSTGGVGDGWIVSRHCSAVQGSAKPCFVWPMN